MRKAIENSEELHIKNLECQYCDDVSTWFALVKQWYRGPDVAAQTGGAPAATSPATGDAVAAPAPAAAAPDPGTGEPSGEQANLSGPKGPGWIIKIEGYHYHNDMKSGNKFGAQYVRDTLLENLLNMKVKLPKGDGSGELEEFTMGELGITYPVLVNPKSLDEDLVDNPYASADAAGGNRGGDDTANNKIKLQRFDFVVQFCWQPKLPSERRAAKEEAKKTQQQPAAGEQVPAQQ